jgi:23S rRNA (guanosine2251-2'-O)-methyltransferase
MKTIIGRKPVLDAINSGEEIDQVYILYGQQGSIITAIRVAAQKKGIKCSEVKGEKFKSITSMGNAQGVAAVISDFRYHELEDVAAESKKREFPLLVILDSIQDPHNLGAIIRSAECAGADGVIITRHNSASVNETVVKTSAGATSYMKVVQVNNLVNAIKYLKEEGFWIVGSTLDNAADYSDVNFRGAIAVILGNEEKGIRRLTAETCDQLIKIPMPGKLQSLNVSVATGVILFEILRQRKGN